MIAELAALAARAARKIEVTHQTEKNLDLRPYDRPHKVLLLACAVNCTTGTILAIT